LDQVGRKQIQSSEFLNLCAGDDKTVKEAHAPSSFGSKSYNFAIKACQMLLKCESSLSTEDSYGTKTYALDFM